MVALLGCLLLTGFVSSAYQRERAKLGDRHFRSGLSLTRANDISGAAEEFRKALLFAPDNSEYRLSLATALVSAGKLEEAEAHLEQLSQEDPTNGQINLLLARVALHQNRLNEAVASYQRAVYEYWPTTEFDKRREARWELIDLLMETGQHRDQVVGELLQLYGNLPPHSDQRLRVGNLLLKTGADAEAAHVFRDILKDTAAAAPAQVAKDSVSAYIGLAKIAFRSGEFIEARHDYQRAQRAAPDDLATTDELQFVNEVIDISPQLPNISPNERLRRSQNLFNRVAGDLQACATEPGRRALLDSRLQSLKTTADKERTDKEDEAALLQQNAQELWRERATFCGSNRAADHALDAVLPRLAQQ